MAAVVGDGEAETGPLATSWHSNKFLDPLHDGVVLPILHLNGWKIANPTVLARIPESELLDLMRGYGHTPYVVSGGFHGEDPAAVHRRMAETMDVVLEQIADIKAAAAAGTLEGRPAWPMIILRTPKGWTCPTEIDGHPAEDDWRAHQVPLASARDTEAHLRILEGWMQSYRPEELFDQRGAPVALATALAPVGERRMSANPVANGGLLKRDLDLPDFRDYAVDVPTPGGSVHEPTRVLGDWLTDVVVRNPHDFRIFGPDETASNRLGGVLRVTDKQFDGVIRPTDEHLARAGRVMEMLSEHQCQGWLEGYLLTGRHGLFTSYEAFIHIVDSMLNQPAKWLKVSKGIPWRRPIASLNYLLSSHVWRQDHNGLSHQDPGFIDHVVNKKADVGRVYLPFDANTLLSTYDHCLRSEYYVNVVVAGKQPSFDWLTMDDAIAHMTRGIGIFDWAGTEVAGEAPDVILACAGDVPTLETLAAVSILRAEIPTLRIRVVIVVDLMRLQSRGRAPARPVGGGVRRAVPGRDPRGLRLPRLPVAHPPPHQPPREQRAAARARLQGGGIHDHAVRHGDAQRHGPVPPRHRRDRPHPGPEPHARPAPPAHGGRPPPRPPVHARARRGHPRGGRLDLGRLRHGQRARRERGRRAALGGVVHRRGQRVGPARPRRQPR